MEPETAFVGALVAIGGTIINGIFLWVAYRRAGEALDLAKANDRREQTRFELDIAASEESRRARLEVDGQSFRPERPRLTKRRDNVERFTVPLLVRNFGPAAARRVVVWLVDGDGNRVTDRERVSPDVLPPDPATPAGVSLMGEMPPPDVLRVRGDWEDDEPEPHDDQPLGPWRYGGG